MVRLIKWLRSLFHIIPSDFHYSHYEKFESALMESGVEAYIYPGGQRIIERGCTVHDVTTENLIDFRRLNRKDRRTTKKILRTEGKATTMYVNRS